jgi:hypothetical protein
LIYDGVWCEPKQRKDDSVYKEEGVYLLVVGRDTYIYKKKKKRRKEREKKK